MSLWGRTQTGAANDHESALAQCRGPRVRRCRVQGEKGAAAEERARASHWPSTQHVTEILIRDGDSFEVALKRFTRKVQQAGVLSEAKRHMHYEPPSVKRKRKAENRARKERKARAKAAARGY